MPLMDHLRELRSRLLKAVIAILIGSVIGWIFYEQIYDFIVTPLETASVDLAREGINVELVTTSVAQPFTIQLKVAALSGMVLASPIWIYQFWAFVTPGLHRHERRYAIAFLVTAVPLFLLGVAAALWIMPKGLELLLGFAQQPTTPLVSVDTYLSFLVRTILVFGIGFLVPIFIIGLNLVGILPASALKRSWRWIVLAVFLFGAIATPTGDPLSMMLLAGPMLVFIFIAFGFAALNDRRKRLGGSEPDYDAIDDDEASAISAPTAIDDED